MSDHPYFSDFSDVNTLYAQFLTDPDAPPQQVHIAQESTNTQDLIKNQAMFGSFLELSRSTPALILQPRRLGALWMAHSYAERYGVTLGEEIGLSGLGGQKYQHHITKDATPHVVMSTCSNALDQSTLLHTVDCVVLCNTQYNSLSMSLVKAVLKQRLQNKERLFIVVYSSMQEQCERDAAYFDDDCVEVTVFTDGDDSSDHPCKWVTMTHMTVADKVAAYLQHGGITTGLIVCVVDQHSANLILDQINTIRPSLRWKHVDTTLISNRSQFHPNVAFLQKPPVNQVRVLVNVGALEAAGISIPWADVVISDGQELMYQPLALNGGFHAVPTDASQATLHQQMRILDYSVNPQYVLCSNIPIIERPVLSLAEMYTIPTTEIVLQILEAGLDPHVVRLDHNIPLHYSSKLYKACTQLHALNLIEFDHPLKRPDAGLFKPTSTLTHSGRQGGYLKLGIVSKALLTAAKQLDVVDVILPILAVLETGGVRHIPIKPHGIDTTSDILDSVRAFMYALDLNNLSADERQIEVRRYNISLRHVKTCQRILANLSQYTGVKPNFADYLEKQDAITSCLLASHLHSLFWSGDPSEKSVKTWYWQDDIPYRICKTSVISENTSHLVSGALREIPANSDRKSFSIITGVTTYTDTDIARFNQTFPHLALTNPLTKKHLQVKPVTSPPKPNEFLPKSLKYTDPQRLEQAVTTVHSTATAVPGAIVDSIVLTDISPASNVGDCQPSVQPEAAPLTVNAEENVSSKEKPELLKDVEVSAAASSLAEAWGAKVTKRS